MTATFASAVRPATGGPNAAPHTADGHGRDRLINSVAAEATVRAAMIRHPKTCPANATVTDVRRLFDDPHIHAALLLGHDNTLMTVIERADVNTAVAGTHAALRFGHLNGRTTGADATLASANQAMSSTGRRRLAVIDDKQHLLGLLCLKSSDAGFCSERDVHNRSLDTPNPRWDLR